MAAVIVVASAFTSAFTLPTSAFVLASIVPGALHDFARALACTAVALALAVLVVCLTVSFVLLAVTGVRRRRCGRRFGASHSSIRVGELGERDP